MNSVLSEETLYYSNFSILNQEDGPKMAKYFLLKKRLILLLGTEWSYYAGRAFYLETIWGQEYLSQKIVFTLAYETWAGLQLKCEDKLERMTVATKDTSDVPQEQKNQGTTFSYRRFAREMMNNKLSTYQGNEEVAISVLQGFYQSACELWQKKTLEDFVEKKKEKNIFSTMFRKTKNIIKPLLLSQVFSYEPEVEEEDDNDMAIEHEATPSKKRQKVVELSEMNLANAKIVNYHTVHKIVDCLERYIKRTRASWQTTVNFVTYLVEINQERLSQINRSLEMPAKNCKIRLLQPAGNFYDRLLELYLLSVSVGPVKKEGFLIKAKNFLKENWNDNYVKGVEFFYEILDKNWMKISTHSTYDINRALANFISLVREELNKYWDQQVVQRALELQKKKTSLNKSNG